MDFKQKVRSQLPAFGWGHFRQSGVFKYSTK